MDWNYKISFLASFPREAIVWCSVSRLGGPQTQSDTVQFLIEYQTARDTAIRCCSDLDGEVASCQWQLWHTRLCLLQCRDKVLGGIWHLHQ